MLRNKSIAFRLSFYILTFTCVTFIAIICYNYLVSQRIILNNVRMSAEHISSATVNKIETVLCSAAKVPQNLASALESTSFTDDELKGLLESVMKNNPEIYGSCIAFEPFTQNKELEYYAPYASRNGDKIDYKNIGNESYQYFYWDWYQIPKELGRPIWTDPYFDEGGGNIVMCTYSVPFYRKEGDKKIFRGIVTVDISLAWLQEMVSKLKIYETGYGFIISRNGTIISYPKKEWIMNESLFSIAEEYSLPDTRMIGREMIKGKSDFIKVGQASSLMNKGWVYYAPLPSNGWSIGIFFPGEELFADMRKLNRTIIVIATIGLVLLLTVTVVITRKITSPIGQLADITQKIGSGNFQTVLPAVQGDDEIGRLTKSFDMMQKQLAEYMANLEHTTAAKEKIESELRIAHDIQMSIIPKLFPPFPDRKEFDIYGILESAKSVGGDLYDFFLMDSVHLCVALGDVSGKGVPASLFMAITRTLLRAKALTVKMPQEIISGMNDDLCKDNDMSMFVTFFIGILDINTGRLTYSNGGHNKPYITKKDGTLKILEEIHGLPLGVAECEYTSSEIMMSPGEKLVIYTDGVTEATSTNTELYNEERLEKVLSKTSKENPKAIIGELMVDIRKFTLGAEQSDDITVLIIEYCGPMA